jgi:hypothetical protein
VKLTGTKPMELDTLSNIEKIASKLKVKDRKRRLEMARQINELAKIVIDLKKSENEKHSNLH